MVVLPDPLTPMTRDHLRPGERLDRKRPRDFGERLLDFFRDDQADTEVFQIAFEIPLGQAAADLARGFRAEIGCDQRLLDLVERFVVKAAGAEPGEVADQPVGGAAKPAAQPVVPGTAAHAVCPSAIRTWSRTPAIRTVATVPGSKRPASATSAKLLAWPRVPGRSISTC